MKSFTIQPTWFCRMLGSKLIETFGNGGDSVTIGDFNIQRYPDRLINVYRTYSDTIQGLNEITRKIRLTVDGGWDEMIFAKKSSNFQITLNNNLKTYTLCRNLIWMVV